MTVEEKALYLDRANKYWYQNTNIIGLYSKESELDVKNAYIDGLSEGRKELEQWKQEWQDAQIKANEEGFERTILQIKYLELKKENKELKERLRIESQSLHEQCEIVCKQVEQIEKMKCCGNCGNERCTSKYRGNSCYHRQEDGYACADNEDWIMRKDK